MDDPLVSLKARLKRGLNSPLFKATMASLRPEDQEQVRSLLIALGQTVPTLSIPQFNTLISEAWDTESFRRTRLPQLDGSGNLIYQKILPIFLPAIETYPSSAAPTQQNMLTIVGPVSSHELVSKKRGIQIYIFGDNHVFSATCPSGTANYIHIKDFIKSVIDENPSKVIDIYLEQTFRKQGDRPRSALAESYLTNVIVMFDRCLQPSKKRCPYKNSRFHYADVRNLGPLNKLTRLFSMTGYNSYEAIENKPAFKREIDLIMSDPDLFDLNKTYLETRTAKQMEHILDPELKNQIASYFTRAILHQMGWAQYLYASATDPTNNNRKESDYFAVFVHLENMSARWMDFYTVARIFRSYHLSKKGYPIESAKNILLYLGEDHAKVIRDCLLNLGFELISVSKSHLQRVNFQCLGLNARYPFFRNLDPNV